MAEDDVLGAATLAQQVLFGRRQIVVVAGVAELRHLWGNDSVTYRFNCFLFIEIGAFTLDRWP